MLDQDLFMAWKTVTGSKIFASETDNQATLYEKQLPRGCLLDDKSCFFAKKINLLVKNWRTSFRNLFCLEFIICTLPISKNWAPQVLGCLRGVLVHICLGSPSVIWPIGQLDRSFVPLPFDRYTFSVLLYKPRQPVCHVVVKLFRPWLCVPAFRQVCHFCAFFYE